MEKLKQKFSAQYRDSYNAVDKAKGEMYAAQANKQARLNEIEQQQQQQLKIVRDKYNDGKGIISRDEYEKELVKIQENAQKEIASVNKETGTAEKRYEVAKAKHDEMKKVYAKDAALEDAYDYFDKTATVEERNKIKNS